MDFARTYDHRYHAANVGDVFKHVAWLGLIAATRGRRALIDTHGGFGSYELGPTGEWTEGAGRLLEGELTGAPPLVTRYLQRVGNSVARRHYPGSPLLSLAELGPEDRSITYELMDDTRAGLERALDDPRAEVRGGDGLAALPGVLSELAGFDERLVLIDPPYAAKSEWPLVADTLISLSRTTPAARALVWYPIKSYTRPNAMLIRLEQGGVAATTLELITSPLTSKKNRLNGSGVILLSPPPGLIEGLLAAIAWLGPRLSAKGRWWSCRVIGL